MAEVTEHTDDAALHDHDEDAARVSDNSSEEERDGRFHGPDASWRFYTKAERDLASSLDQIENNDLSAHLYNAHHLKRRLYGPTVPEPWHSKQRWLSRDDTGRVPFHPDRTWTAWPLKPAEVPRTSEQWGVPPLDEEGEAETHRKRMKWTPGAQLRECMQAEILRQAKERFRARVSAEDVVYTRGTDLRPPSQPDSDDDESDTSSSHSSQSSVQDESSEPGSDEEAKGGPASPDSTLHPLPTSDDEFAADIARPTVNHIMAKLDDLLRGLHQSRQGQRRPRSRSRSGNATRKTRSSSGAASRDQDTASRSQSPARPSDDSSARKSRKRQELGPRDWSEVLGVAALVGWDQALVARAAQRCAALFDEHMEFRAMPAIVTNKRPDKVARSERDGEDPPKEVTAELPEALTGIDGYHCPHSFCSRHRESYLQLWRLREHLKRKHKHLPDEVDTMVGHIKQALAHRETGSEIAGTAQGQHDLMGGHYTSVDHRSVEAEYLQPILIKIGRSKDKKVRRTPSRERSRKAGTSLHENGTGDEGEAGEM